MNVKLWVAMAFVCATMTMQAQQATVPGVKETVVVVGQLDAVTEGQSQRSVAALEVQPQRLAVDGVADLLRDDVSVDVEQRGGGGAQNDLSIRGASFEQTLVLLNGLRINDAETSHFNLDVPVPFDALGGAYVLHGAGSTQYGSDAVSGVVNITTAQPADGLSLRLRAGAASFGGNTEAAVASWAHGKFSEVAAGGRDFSEGFISDRDYRSEEASSETRFHSLLGESDLLLAGSDRAFGANGFYGPYDSFERTKGWFAAITQQIDAKTSAALAYRRHTDIFELFRENPAAYKNQHIDYSWQGTVRRTDRVKLLSSQIDYGLDINADEIHSNNLGNHGRNRGAGYVDLRSRVGSGGMVTIGLREEIFSGGRAEFVPAFSASQYLGESVKLRSSITRGFRLPTYTDLYYSDPVDIPNPLLKPESAWSYDGGVDWYPSGRWAVSATGFTSQQTDVIDYVRTDLTQPWRAQNLTHVALSGGEFSVEWRPAVGQQVRASLTTLTGARDALNGLQSKQVFNYPVQNGLVEYIAHLKQGLMLRESLCVVNRIARDVYPVVDSSLAYEGWRVHPYVQMTNLSNTSYQEIVGVPMPGRGFAGGIEVELQKRR